MADYNIQMNVFNQTEAGYDQLYPVTKPANIDGTIPISGGGTNATTASTALYNLISGAGATTPTTSDFVPLIDVSGATGANATIESILSLAPVGAQIQTGSYVGTGSYGEANPCSLTFDFVPRFFAVQKKDIDIAVTDYFYTGIYVINPSSYTVYVQSHNGQFSASPVYILWENNTVKYYASESSVIQYNNNGDTYCYLALG